MKALLSTLRTHNIFPIEPNATKIAESVEALYNSSEDGSVDLSEDEAAKVNLHIICPLTTATKLFYSSLSAFVSRPLPFSGP